ncbi:unnamed protein product [Gordionus sp. m RMFG-2023]
MNNKIYLSGQIGIDPKTSELVLGGIDMETKQVMKNIKAILEEANSDMNNIIKATIMLANINDMGKVNEIYQSYFQKGAYPARSAFQVAALPKQALIEIEIIAISK